MIRLDQIRVHRILIERLAALDQAPDIGPVTRIGFAQTKIVAHSIGSVFGHRTSPSC